MTTIAKRFRLWAMWLFMPRHQTSAHFEDARSTWTAREGNVEVSLTIRDLTKPDNFGRETIYTMLRTVRENERRMGWKCPEPELRPEKTV